MSDWWLGFLTGFVPTVSAAILGWLQFWHQLREKRLEQEAREKVENELRVIRRRGNAPFLVPDLTSFNYFVLPPEKPGELPMVDASHPLLLCFDRHEVGRDAPKGYPVVFVITNKGESADKVRITLDGAPVRLVNEPDFETAHGLLAITYDYDPARHGREQVLEVWFQARSGFEDTHRYRTRHGFRILERTDPP